MAKRAADILELDRKQKLAPVVDRFSRRLGDFSDWRDNLVVAIESYVQWLGLQESVDSENELRVYELLGELREGKLTIALVGEFSRGKTELINAIFFADYNRRLLPSTPGRTTMCPAEILWDSRMDPCIRLLPIETRKSSMTIAEYKRSPIQWSTVPLNTDSAEEMADAMQEIILTKSVSEKEARSLGFEPPPELTGNDNIPTDTVDVPVWRHAIINYPHPLLKRGLVILDTPGLNALGSEPELTLNMIPKAHAVLLVLGADTGVTKSDLDVWKNHVCSKLHRANKSRIAALNKIDTLWDELLEESEIERDIGKQVTESAQLLDIPLEDVFPVSAQKGLVGKVRHDPALVERSGLPRLEDKLSGDIVEEKQQMLREKISHELGGMIEASSTIVKSQLDNTTQELQEIGGLRGKSRDVIRDINKHLLKQKELYAKEMESFNVTRQLLQNRVMQLLSLLNVKRFDNVMQNAQESMNHTWTTAGLRKKMGNVFDIASDTMEKVKEESEEIRSLVSTVYEHFHKKHGLVKIKPAQFSTTSFVNQFTKLEAEAEAFRTSAAVVVTEQHFVTRKFFITMVHSARDIFSNGDTSARNWAKSVLSPIYTQIQDHKAMIDRRITNLEQLLGDHSTLNQRMADLEEKLKELQANADLIDGILKQLQHPPPNSQN
ncbi:MAG: dynamin family protein [Gammaproteobacteria bacterium]|nr:dynamin family protein [Gammaproteobacteria bacterium]